MLIVASDAHRAHHPREPFLDRGHLLDPPEVPERVDRILGAIAERRSRPAGSTRRFGPAPILRVHSPSTSSSSSTRTSAGARRPVSTRLGGRRVRPRDPRPAARRAEHIIAQLGWYSHDNDPMLAGTYAAASGAVDVTLTAWEAVADGARPRRVRAGASARPSRGRPTRSPATATSTTRRSRRRPGPIAARASRSSTSTITTATARSRSSTTATTCCSSRSTPIPRRVPVLPGLRGRTGWGAGEDCNRNFPLPAGTEWDTTGPRSTTRSTAVRKFGPDAVVVSLGVDTALEDPDTFRLVADDYPRIGARSPALDRPTLVVQEGGYCLDVIGRNVAGRAARARLALAERRRAER